MKGQETQSEASKLAANVARQVTARIEGEQYYGAPILELIKTPFKVVGTGLMALGIFKVGEYMPTHTLSTIANVAGYAFLGLAGLQGAVRIVASTAVIAHKGRINRERAKLKNTTRN